MPTKRNEKGQFVKGSHKDYTGIKRGRWTFVEFDHTHVTPAGKKIPYWAVRCECGTEAIRSTKDIMSGHSKSCGCLQKEKVGNAQRVHGESDTPLHIVWQNMRRRSYEKTNAKYGTYGERGIKVCDEWKDDYVAFAKWARANGYEEGLTIERIDVDGDYEPSNCTWISSSEQSRNKTVTHYHEINGKTYQTMNDVSDAFEIPVKTLYSRYYRGDRGSELVRPIGKRRWKKTPR